MSPSRRGGRAAWLQSRRALPVVYLVAALLVAFVVLPSALRPPPDPATESGAINPNAPPDPNNPQQIFESLQQAAGGGAGATGRGASTTTTAPGRRNATTGGADTSTTLPPSFSQCYGNPPRQAASVYAASCAPVWHGDNGGSTWKNVFPGEIRLGFSQGTGYPNTVGPIPTQITPGENASDRTMTVLMQWVNEHFQTYGRHISFYGVPPYTTYDDELAASATADETDHLFASYYLGPDYCVDQAHRQLVTFCDPQQHSLYTQNRPYTFSFLMDLTQQAQMGAEYACKTLVGRAAKFAGAGVQGTPRKLGYVTVYGGGWGERAADFVAMMRRECGYDISADAFEMAAGDQNGASTAVSRLRLDGVTTVILDTDAGSAQNLMLAADSVGWVPEWVGLGSKGLDFNLFGAGGLPKEQAAHLFGLSGWEMPQRPQDTECYQAYRSIDPNNTPDGVTCGVFWQPILMMLDGIQEAGPHLTPQTFQDGLFAMGHRFYTTPVWAIGGGYGPDDYTYMDNEAEIWWSNTAVDPQTGATGAYVWTHNGARYQRGQFTGDDSQLFSGGTTEAPPGS